MKLAQYDITHHDRQPLFTVSYSAHFVRKFVTASLLLTKKGGMRHFGIIYSLILTSWSLVCVQSFLTPMQFKSLQQGPVASMRSDFGSIKAESEGGDGADKKVDAVSAGPARTDLGDLFGQPVDVQTLITGSKVETSGDEKIAAIQMQIADRIAVLKKEQQWSDGPDVFGKDPLATQPIWQTMAEQIKICKPFESVEELATTYFLLLATTTFLSTYLLVLRDAFDGFIVWFTKTDFDNQFLSILFNQS